MGATALLLVSLPARGRASCHAPVASLHRHLDAVGVAFQRMDEAGMRAAHARVGAELPCVDARLTPGDAAKIYEMTALEAFLVGDDAGVHAGLRAALRADPSYALAPALAPVGGVLHGMLEDARRLPAAQVRTLPARARPLQIDGRAADARPVEGPVLLQALGDGGGAEHSALVQGPEPLPEWALQPAPASVSLGEGLGWTAGGLALASAGVWTAFAVQRDLYAAASADALAGHARSQAALDRRWRRTNALGTTAIVGSGLALGVGAAAAVAW